MKKYFVLSDIHSFAKEMKTALRKAGFRKTNKDHILIICGDLFDRGSESVEVYNYIYSIPKSRRVLIRGNHELLYFTLLDKKFPEEHDFNNGTVRTFCQIAGMTMLGDTSMEKYLESGYKYTCGMFGDIEFIDQDCQLNWDMIKNKVINSDITKWLKSDEWKDYYELDKFIFVHSFIPLNDSSNLPIYYLRGHEYSYKNDWRESTHKEWENAMWGCPWSLYESGLFKEEKDNGKVLVCGHWHTSDFFRNLKLFHLYDHECAPIYFSKGLIGLDGGCMYNPHVGKYVHPQNVLIIDNGICYSYNTRNNKIEELEELKHKFELYY